MDGILVQELGELSIESTDDLDNITMLWWQEISSKWNGRPVRICCREYYHRQRQNVVADAVGASLARQMIVKSVVSEVTKLE